MVLNFFHRTRVSRGREAQVGARTPYLTQVKSSQQKQMTRLIR